MSEIESRSSVLPPVPALKILAEYGLDGNGTLTNQVYGLLRHQIIELNLLPNQFLSEKDVAEALNISKTPVREAFIRLSEDGMVRILSKSGTYVTPIDITRVSEGYFIWTALESACAAEVAEKRSLEDVYLFRVNLLRQKKALAESDFPNFYTLDNVFHNEMFRIAGYPNAQRLIETAKFEVDRMRTLRLRFHMRPVPAVYAEHEAVVDAIAKRDAENAKRSMFRHLSRVREALETLVDSEELWSFFHQINQKPARKRTARIPKKMPPTPEEGLQKPGRFGKTSQCV